MGHWYEQYREECKKTSSMLSTNKELKRLIESMDPKNMQKICEEIAVLRAKDTVRNYSQSELNRKIPQLVAMEQLQNDNARLAEENAALKKKQSEMSQEYTRLETMYNIMGEMAKRITEELHVYRMEAHTATPNGTKRIKRSHPDNDSDDSQNNTLVKENGELKAKIAQLEENLKAARDESGHIREKKDEAENLANQFKTEVHDLQSRLEEEKTARQVEKIAEEKMARQASEMAAPASTTSAIRSKPNQLQMQMQKDAEYQKAVITKLLGVIETVGLDDDRLLFNAVKNPVHTIRKEDLGAKYPQFDFTDINLTVNSANALKQAINRATRMRREYSTNRQLFRELKQEYEEEKVYWKSQILKMDELTSEKDQLKKELEHQQRDNQRGKLSVDSLQILERLLSTTFADADDGLRQVLRTGIDRFKVDRVVIPTEGLPVAKVLANLFTRLAELFEEEMSVVDRKTRDLIDEMAEKHGREVDGYRKSLDEKDRDIRDMDTVCKEGLEKLGEVELKTIKMFEIEDLLKRTRLQFDRLKMAVFDSRKEICLDDKLIHESIVNSTSSTTDDGPISNQKDYQETLPDADSAIRTLKDMEQDFRCLLHCQGDLERANTELKIAEKRVTDLEQSLGQTVEEKEQFKERLALNEEEHRGAIETIRARWKYDVEEMENNISAYQTRLIDNEHRQRARCELYATKLCSANKTIDCYKIETEQLQKVIEQLEGSIARPVE